MRPVDWHSVGGFLSVSAMVTGIGAAFLIDGMEPAVFVGTIPSFVYGAACFIHNRSRKK